MSQIWLQRIAWAAIGVIAWLISASAMFLWLSGWLTAPGLSPVQRLLMWWLYWPAVGRDLIETAYWGLSVLVFPAFVGALFGRLIKWKAQAVTNSLYGNAAPATRDQMQAGGFRIRAKL